MGRRRNSFVRRLWQLLLVGLVAWLLVTFRLPEKVGIDRAPEDRFVVKQVIDGDTFELSGGDKVRLLSVDTPEKDEPLHDQARDYLKQLIQGKTVHLEYGKDRRDKYGRMLAYVFIDTLFVNEAILYNGYGNLYLFKQDEVHLPKTDELLSAQRHALDAHTGLWAIAKKAEVKYYAREHAFRFHRPNCPTLAEDPGNLREIATREQALYEGLSPCRTCHP